MNNSIEDIKKHLSYDPETGVFRWKIRRKGRRFDAPVGHLNAGGYLVARISGIDYYLHRIAMAFSYGEWPPSHTDHVNGDKSDNRLVNLRAVTPSVNGQNRRGAKKNNKHGLIGVSYFKQTGRYSAQIHINRKKIHLGYYATAELANSAYKKAKTKIHAGIPV